LIDQVKQREPLALAGLRLSCATPTIRGHEDVVRLQVAMHDKRAMRVFYRRTDIEKDPQLASFRQALRVPRSVVPASRNRATLERSRLARIWGSCCFWETLLSVAAGGDGDCSSTTLMATV